MLARQQRTWQLPLRTGRTGLPWRLSSGRVRRSCLSRTQHPVLAIPASALIQQAAHDLHGKAFLHHRLDLHKAGLPASASQHPGLVEPGQQPVTSGDRLGLQERDVQWASKSSHRTHSG